MIGFSLFLSSVQVDAQLLQDTAVLNLVKKDVDYIYNMQFEDARGVYSQIVHKYPGHPIIYLLRGIMTYWENYPMVHTNPVHVSFEEDMRECIKLSEANDCAGHEAEYLLATLSAQGMLLSYYEDNDLVSEVTPLAISTYKHVRRAFDYVSDCADLYYFTGLFNYYREAYPRAYPVYRSLAFLFPRGDTETGLKEFRTAAVSSVVLQAESYSMLTWLYLSFENNYSESLYYTRTLYEKYRGNLFYLETYIRNLLLMKNYSEAEKLISDIPEADGNKFARAQLIILKGILEEKKYCDKNLAKEYYNEGIRELSLFSDYGNEYASYAYFGLSRIDEADGEKRTSRIYRKEAMKLSVFKKINFDK
ncbi:MAG TPA: hypothetical protein PLR88_04225 [Bacteroidales bacterium]|nr:hypothetical protein [Bacteroidales bacterium]